MLKISRAALAKSVGCTQQAVGQWERGDIKEISAERLRLTAKQLGCSIEYLLTGDKPESVASDPAADHVGKLSQNDLDLLAGYRTLTEELQTAVWDIIDSHMRRQHPDLVKALGRRDIAKSLAAEPNIRTTQIITQSRRPPKPAKKPANK